MHGRQGCMQLQAWLPPAAGAPSSALQRPARACGVVARAAHDLQPNDVSLGLGLAAQQRQGWQEWQGCRWAGRRARERRPGWRSRAAMRTRACLEADAISVPTYRAAHPPTHPPTGSWVGRRWRPAGPRAAPAQRTCAGRAGVGGWDGVWAAAPIRNQQPWLIGTTCRRAQATPASQPASHPLTNRRARARPPPPPSE